MLENLGIVVRFARIRLFAAGQVFHLGRRPSALLGLSGYGQSGHKNCYISIIEVGGEGHSR
jgi:hypothetical protein